MQGNNAAVFVKQLSSLPAVKGVSRSLLISSLGSLYGSSMKYKDPADSTMVDLNDIDEHYLPLHRYVFLAGRNFESRPKNAPKMETIVNQELIRRFNIGHNNPQKAIGESISIDHQKLTIVGVLRDFHYGSLQSSIDPTAFRYSADPGGYVNVKLSAANTAATMTSIETLWKQTDNIHPLDAKFYDDQIEHAYSQFSIMLKVIGFFAFLAICISSLGLFGMVIYTMEKRLKEISIRKVLGAGDGKLLFLLSKGFLFLFLIAAAIALPLTWLLFQKVILANFAYHQPIRSSDLFVGVLLMAGLVVLMIGMQTLKVVRANPARVLKTE
jgi:ABC-type antimicrobial peptide transport system permease subunit